MERRTLAVAAGVLLVLAGVAAAVLLRRGDDGPDPALAAFSVRGTPTTIALPERFSAPNSPKFTGEAFLIAQRDGLRFLRLPREDGSSCWSVADRRLDSWQVVEYGCEFGFVRFPDPTRPIMLAVRTRPSLTTGLTDYDSFAGFAADAVKRVAIIDEHDRLVPVADVTGNVFYSPKPPTRAKAVAALDAAGKVIWSGFRVQQPSD